MKSLYEASAKSMYCTCTCTCTWQALYQTHWKSTVHVHVHVHVHLHVHVHVHVCYTEIQYMCMCTWTIILYIVHYIRRKEEGKEGRKKRTNTDNLQQPQRLWKNIHTVCVCTPSFSSFEKYSYSQSHHLRKIHVHVYTCTCTHPQPHQLRNIYTHSQPLQLSKLHNMYMYIVACICLVSITDYTWNLSAWR